MVDRGTRGRFLFLGLSAAFTVCAPLDVALAAPVQLEALLMAMPSLPRTTLERAVERMIDRLDVIDGDADHEPDGDELDEGNAEDETLTASALIGHGPGCPISDPTAIGMPMRWTTQSTAKIRRLSR